MTAFVLLLTLVYVAGVLVVLAYCGQKSWWTVPQLIVIAALWPIVLPIFAVVMWRNQL